MKTHLVIGPRTEIDIEAIDQSSIRHNQNVLFYGDGINARVDLSGIEADENDRIIVHVHGGCNSDAKHQINLYSASSKSRSLDYTSYNFQRVKKATQNKPINLELFACHAGAANTDIVHLPEGSTLLTFVSSEDLLIDIIANDLILQSIGFEDTSNPLKNFVSYLCVNPDTNTFAIKTKTGCKFFTSDIETLDSYSAEGIKKWQMKQLSKFVSFLVDNLNELPDRMQSQMHRLQLALDHQRERWCSKFDIEKYQKYLIVNFMYRNQTEKLVNMLSNMDRRAIMNSPVFLESAISNNNPQIIQLLVDSGADPNYRLPSSDTYLIFAVAGQKNIETIRMLLDKGADVNYFTNDGNTALSLAVNAENIALTKLLLKRGADPNMDQDLLIEAVKKDNIKLVKVLLAAGVDTSAFCPDKSSEIRDEINRYNSNPVNYIITNSPKNILPALRNLLKQEHQPDRVKNRCKAIIQVEESKDLLRGKERAVPKNASVFIERKGSSRGR